MQKSWTGFQGYSANFFSLPPFSFEYADQEPVKESSNHARTVSAEPIASSKVTFHHRGSQSLDLAKAALTKATDEYQAFTVARAALSAKKRKELKRRSHHSIESVSALRHLCSKCQIFPLQACLNSPEPGRVWTSPLKRLIWHKDDCPLCSLLIRSLCQTDNDPFKHPLVYANLPDELRNDTMATWLTAATLDEAWVNTNVSWSDLQKWPFGVGVIEGENKLAETSFPGEFPFIAPKDLTQGFVASISDDDGSHTHATSPCYIAISNNFTSPGLLDMKLWGYPRGAEAQIVTLTQFRLRIESDWSPTELERKDVPFAYGHVLEPDQIDLNLGRMWLDNCEQTHGVSCSKQAWPFNLGWPECFRLVDVDDLSVIEVTGPQVSSYRYLALSYVRGEAPTFQLLQSNKNKLLRTHGLLKIFRQSLPKTIRDAIYATRTFGERYLWIDSLCVIQDDVDDMRQQLEMMDRIYGNALLTIVAADAEHADVGLAGVDKGSRQVNQICEEIEPGFHMMLPLPEPKGLATSPWNNRAWTFQECLLSRRLAIFTGDRLVWRCRKAVAFEDMTAAESGEELEDFAWLSIRPLQLGVQESSESHLDCSIEKLRNGKSRILRSSTFKEYANLVTQYSQRRLKHSSDALQAIAGLSHVLELCFRGPIKQGLPETSLDAALLWRPAARLQRRNVPGIASWSWAGWEGGVRYEDAFQINTNDWALKRVVSDTGTEAFRPLLRYFGWRIDKLQPLNGNGLGIPLQSHTEELPQEWDKYPPMLSPRKAGDDLGYWDYIMDDIENLLLDSDKVAESRVNIEQADLPESILSHLSSHHLVFRTSCTESIQFGRLKRSAVVDPKIPLQYPILEGAETRVVKKLGHLRLDGDGPRSFDPSKHSLIVISEALYFSIDQDSQQDDSSSDFPLYNVMLIEWNEERTLASRLGLGRLYKESWKMLRPPPVARTVVLG